MTTVKQLEEKHSQELHNLRILVNDLLKRAHDQELERRTWTIETTGNSVFDKWFWRVCDGSGYSFKSGYTNTFRGARRQVEKWMSTAGLPPKRRGKITKFP